MKAKRNKRGALCALLTLSNSVLAAELTEIIPGADHAKQANREAVLEDAADPQDSSWEARVIEVETRARLFELVRRLQGGRLRVRFGDAVATVSADVADAVRVAVAA